MSENKKIKGCGFHHVFMKVGDLEKSLKFYTEALGFVEKASWGQGPGRMVLLDTGDGNYFEISQGDPEQIKEGGLFLHVALRRQYTGYPDSAGKDRVLQGTWWRGDRAVPERADVIRAGGKQPESRRAWWESQRKAVIPFPLYL